MNRRMHLVPLAAAVAAAALLPGSVRATAQAAPPMLGAWSTNDSPYAVAVNPEGDVWVAYADTPRLVRYDVAGHSQVSVPLDPSVRPLGIAVDDSGNAYVSDNFNSTVLKYSRSGALVSTWSDVVNAPVGIGVDSSNDVFVVDGNFNDVVELNSSGAKLIEFGGSSDFTPSGLTLDASGNVYVTDTDSNLIRKFSPGGAALATYGGGFGSGNGQFDLPEYAGVDTGGNVFASDENNNRIQVLTPAGQFLNTWGSGGGGNGEFTNPLGIAVDVAGNVYVADEGNARVQKFFYGIEPCNDLFGTNVGACNTARSACMAKLAPRDEASCLAATKQQYDPLRGVHAADRASATAKPAEAKTSGRIVVRVQLTGAGSPAAGKTVHLAFGGLRARLGVVHATPASARTNSAGVATFTVTTTRAGAGSYVVGVVDVTDAKTFANVTSLRFG